MGEKQQVEVPGWSVGHGADAADLLAKMKIGQVSTIVPLLSIGKTR